jgi:plasmid stabilization system protein ParE
MARVIYSEAALGDLERIIDFALNASPATAAGTFERIRTAIDILSSHPLIGRRIDADIRELIISHGATGYIALYRFDGPIDVVRLLRIRHQREAGYRP